MAMRRLNVLAAWAFAVAAALPAVAGAATPPGGRAAAPPTTVQVAAAGPRHLDVDAVRARITREARALPPSKVVVAFDWDGTLWKGKDVASDALAIMMRDPSRIRTPAVRAMQTLAREHEGVLTPDQLTRLTRSPRSLTPADRAELTHAVHAAYKDGRIPATSPLGDRHDFRAWIYAGWTRKEADAFARGAVDELGVKEQLRGETVDVLRWAKAQGYSVRVVSASPSFVVRAAIRGSIDPHGTLVSDDDVMGTTPRSAYGRYLAGATALRPYREAKVTLLDRATKPAGQRVVAFFGDSVGDEHALKAYPAYGVGEKWTEQGAPEHAIAEELGRDLVVVKPKDADPPPRTR